MNEILVLNELEKGKIKKYIRDFYGVFTEINFLSIETVKTDLNYNTMVKLSMTNRYVTIEFQHNDPSKLEADKDKYASLQKVYFKIEPEKESGIRFFEDNLELIDFQEKKYYKILEIYRNYNKIDSKLKPLIENFYTIKPFHYIQNSDDGYQLEIERNEVSITKKLNHKISLTHNISKNSNGNVVNEILNISEMNFENLVFSYSKNKTLDKDKRDFNYKDKYTFYVLKENDILKDFNATLNLNYNHHNIISSYSSKKSELSIFFKYEKENLKNQGTDDFSYTVKFNKNNQINNKVDYLYESNGTNYSYSELKIDSDLFFSKDGHEILSITDDLDAVVLEKNASYINYCLKEINFESILKYVEIPDITTIKDFIDFKNIQLNKTEMNEKSFRNTLKHYLEMKESNLVFKNNNKG